MTPPREVTVLRHWYPLVVSIMILGLFFAWAEVQKTAQKPMWGDEIYGLLINVRSHTVRELLVHGAYGQGSPAPLDYLLLKLLDVLRSPLQYLGLHPLTYWRLVAFGGSFLGGLLVAGMAIRVFSEHATLRVARSILLVGALTAFWFQHYCYFFSAEMRPYALWHAEIFVIFVGLIGWPRFKILTGGALYLLAMTATASVFQIVACAVAFSLVQAFQGRSWRQVAKEAAFLFAGPLALAYYYCPKAGGWGYVGKDSGPWNEFKAFWLGKEHVWILSIIGIAFASWKRETRRYATGLLALFILYLMTPGIFWLTKRSGFFFSDRQYIYYELDVPLLLLVLALCLPFFEWAKHTVKTTAVALVTAGVTVLAFTHRFDWLREDLALHGTRKVPIDPRGELADLLTRETPQGFCFDGLQDRKVDPVDTMSVYADYLSIRYANKPKGAHYVHVKIFPIRQNIEVTGIDVTPCTSGIFVPVPGR